MIGLLTAVGLLVTASPAWAVSESGSLYCSEIYQTPTARAKAYGDLYLTGPGDPGASYYSLGSSWQVRENPGSGGYWRASITGFGGLDNGGTYAYCRN